VAVVVVVMVSVMGEQAVAGAGTRLLAELVEMARPILAGVGEGVEILEREAAVVPE
jgi:hypothetical protein